MNSRLLAFTAAIAIAGATQSPAVANDQTPSEPAGTPYAPAPTIAEELVYLRDIVALQTLRLDEAEEKIERQSATIDTQQRRIVALERVANLESGAAGFLATNGFHVVESGETLYSISRRYGASVDAVAAANNLRAPYILSVGQRVAVPGAGEPAALAAASPAPTTQARAEKVTQPQPESAQLEPQRVASVEPAGPTAGERPDVTERALEAERRREEKAPAEGALPTEVGVRPEEEDKKPYLAIFSDVGGILTPRGTFYVEPAVDFTLTSDNRFFFQGVEIVEAVLIGAIEATDSDRRAATESLGVRYGVTNRLELDGRMSFISRKDRISGVAIDDQTTTVRDLDGQGIGDAEMGLHYQLNNGVKLPYTILNLRAKAPTGLGPFEVARTADRGIELELATGSGYWSVEPSVTFIKPTDPAVIFANVGYQANLATKPDAVIGPSIFREFDPGDAIRASVGVGLSLNERFSVNFGLDSSYFFRTHTLVERTVRDPILDQITGEPVNDAFGNPVFGPPRIVLTDLAQPSTTVGSFLFGASYTVSDRVRLNLNTSFGATDEAPDMRISLRAQVKLFD